MPLQVPGDERPQDASVPTQRSPRPGVVAWGPCRGHHAGRRGAGTLQWFGTRVLAETGEVKQCPLGAIRELMGELGADPAALATVPK